MTTPLYTGSGPLPNKRRKGLPCLRVSVLREPQQGNLPLEHSRHEHSDDPKRLRGVEEKRGFRTKTVATRITPEELREVETAAEREGKALAEWLRDLALKAARQRPADPMELLLAEQSATRYMLLSSSMRPPRRTRKGSTCWPNPCSESATRRTPGSWPTPAR